MDEYTSFEELPKDELEQTPEVDAIDASAEEISDGDGALAEEDYSSDLALLSEEFSELRGASELSSLDNPERYAELRGLGLTPKEAFLATQKRREVHDNRSHLGSAVPRRAKSPSLGISQSELRAARELFAGASDQEIIRLYKRVTN